jgi:hypothetical protein
MFRVIRAGEFGFSPRSLGLSLNFLDETPVFLLDFERNMHRDKQRRCLHADGTCILLAKMA